MSLEYEARAVCVADSQNGRKIVVYRTICGRTLKVACDPNQADFVIRELNTVEPPCA